jgi:3-phenylpropionate/cinnamic acid dioxygenase small subunit
MKPDRGAICDLLAEYGALIDMAKFDEWLGLFAEECRYQIVPRENFDRGLPAALIFCDSGLPRIFEDGLTLEASFAVFQTDQEGETRLFATGLYRDRLQILGRGLKIRDKLILLDTFAVPSLLATPL